MRAAPIRNQSPEDIYENLDGADEPVPSQRRITVRVGRSRPRDVHDLETQPPPKPPTRQMLAGEHEIPDQSVRRLRIATARVSGAPTSIQELVTEAMLRDPRRD
jgi:hypothetical protein